MKKPKSFIVSMRALAIVKGSLAVEAVNQHDAINRAAAQLGDVIWEYDGLDKLLDDSTVVREG